MSCAIEDCEEWRGSRTHEPPVPRPRHAAGEPVEELSCDGQSVPCQAGRSDSATSCGSSPSTRIPLPSHAAAAACLSTSVPPAIRRAGLLRYPDKGHDIGSFLCRARDLAPRPVAICTPDCSPNPRGFPRAAAQWPLRSRPRSRATATWRSVPLRRVDRATAQIAARHVGHHSVPSHARHFVRQRPRKAANERGGLYHAVITPASLACLANPLPHKAWMPLPPPVTTPFRAVSAGRHRG